MKKNKCLPFTDVTHITRELCEVVDGKRYDILSVKISLRDNDELKEYISVIACPEAERMKVVDEIMSFNGKEKSEFSVNPEYCHIATFDRGDFGKAFISFNKEDDYPIKADFNDEFSYIRTFFESFIEFRNRLIKEGRKVKDDDIYQYFLSITSGLKKKDKDSFKAKIVKLVKKKN